MQMRPILSGSQKLIELKSLWERKFGVPYDYLMALSNLIQELGPLGNSSEDIEKIWFRYRAYLLASSFHHRCPSTFSGFHCINGLENLEQYFQDGALLLTYHYGAYRHLAISLGDIICNNLSENHRLAVLVDKDSLENEQKLESWRQLKARMGVEHLVAEDASVGLKILRLLKKKGFLLIYLDGNTGVSGSDKDLRIPFLSSTIRLKGGLFHLLARIERPLIPVMAYQDEYQRPYIQIHSPIWVNTDRIEVAADNTLEVLRKAILQAPEQWRFWFRHHEEVLQWADRGSSREVQTHHPRWYCSEISPSLYVDTWNGRIYQG
ncbi:hypothetical protein HY230_10850 [Candidatus Acetothermia bacterium]|nr:hypothetical protein [Candidatus Acetothermia bacterium]